MCNGNIYYKKIMKLIITKAQAQKILNNIPDGCSIKITVKDANRILEGKEDYIPTNNSL